MTSILLKRAYDPSSSDDGFRVYIDRLWPRGLSHETFHYDLWDKDIAPSTELREWFHADPDGRWTGFKQKYTDELRHSVAFNNLKDEIKRHPVTTLLYSSHDKEHNNAIVVKEALQSLLS